MLKKKILGRTTFEVTEIGFGGWGIGSFHYGDVSEKEGRACIETYLQCGGNFIDTARLYNNSEKIISVEKKADNDELHHKQLTLELRQTIQKARCLKSLTQKQLANNVNLPIQVIADIESGKAIYNGQHINKIKRYLKLQ